MILSYDFLLVSLKLMCQLALFGNLSFKIVFYSLRILILTHLSHIKT